uniref:Protein kinase UbiB n=1 Tax=Candidatus Methanogaster sp. ANME-2c ERB4 TaxID=2759911 RepID=A0A7G9YNU4_9EURY|nr:protein kinase UbiB [Methanosarcinales archaeon ANME-2c ERB4]QNO49678.1 protein kinase UbiB [Methanosarcinales archaeon ANME-2c ERB4]
MSIHKIGVVSRTYCHIERYRQIISVLFKYGFGDVIDILHIGHYIEIALPKRIRREHEAIEEFTLPERVRMAMEELGPTFVKMGQILSTRPDLIPMEFITQFEKLQDDVPPFHYEDVKNTIESELKAPMDTIFWDFDETPVAAASIGQVHRAILATGEDVAVKVQRPDIKKTIEIDLEIMFHLATLLEQNVDACQIYHPTRIVMEFADTIKKEIDYNNEAFYIERFSRQFLDDPTVYVPKVFLEATTVKVLTMEYIDGIKVSDIDRLEKEGFDRKVIAARGADLIFKQIFVHGFFHADPHPGNIVILAGNVVCYLDFGMMGRINRQTREDIVDLVLAIVRRNEAKATDALLRLTKHDAPIDRRRLEMDVADIVSRYLEKSLKEVDAGQLLHQFMDLISQYRLQIPPDLFMMIKAITMVEGFGTVLDPDFDYTSSATPFIKRIRMERMHPKRVVADMLNSGVEIVHLLKEIPGGLRDILEQVKRGQTTIRFEHRGLEPMQKTLDQVSNRISFAIVLASLVMGSGLIVLAGIPPLWHDIPIIGIIGFLGAGAMGFWLLYSILRHGQM